MSVCADCYRPIMFVPTETTGTPMPLDPEHTGDGNIVLIRDLLGDQRAHVLTTADRAEGRYSDQPRYRAHFASCPAKEHTNG